MNDLPPDAENPYPRDGATFAGSPEAIAWDRGFAAGRAAASLTDSHDGGDGLSVADQSPAAHPDPPNDAAPEVIMDANGNYWRRYADGSLSMCPTSTDNLPLAEPVVVYRSDLGVWPDRSAQHAVLLDEIRELHQENERLRAASPDPSREEIDSLYGLLNAQRADNDRLRAALAAASPDERLREAAVEAAIRALGPFVTIGEDDEMAGAAAADAVLRVVAGA